MGIRCVIRQFSASQDLTGDMIFRPKLFKFRPKKSVKKPKNQSATANFKIGTGFSEFFGLQPLLKLWAFEFWSLSRTCGYQGSVYNPLPCDLDVRLASYHNNISVKTKIEEH